MPLLIGGQKRAAICEILLCDSTVSTLEKDTEPRLVSSLVCLRATVLFTSDDVRFEFWTIQGSASLLRLAFGWTVDSYAFGATDGPSLFFSCGQLVSQMTCCVDVHTGPAQFALFGRSGGALSSQTNVA